MDNEIAETAWTVVILWTTLLMTAGFVGYTMATYGWHTWIWRKLTGEK